MRIPETLGAVLCGLLVGPLGAAEPSAKTPLPETLVARGRGFQVTRDEWDRIVVEQKAAFRARGQALAPAQERQIERQVLERLVHNRLLLALATEEDRARGKTNAHRVVAERKQRAGSDETYRRQLLVAGTSPEEFESRLLDQTVAEEVVRRELRSKVTVTEEAVREFYERGVDVQARELEGVAARLAEKNQDTMFYRDATNRLDLILKANLARLDRPAQAKARMIALFITDPLTRQPLSDEIRKAKRERLQRLRERARAGEDFAQLARDYSEEPDAARTGGEYLAELDRVSLTPLRDALASQPLNEVGEVVETPMAYYLLQVLERPPAGKVSFEEARESLRDRLVDQEVEKRLPGWFERLSAEYTVELRLPSPE